MRIPVVLGKQLHEDINSLAAITHYSSQDIMRLALRIGLTDLLSVGNDLPTLVKQSADSLGLSFAAFAHNNKIRLDISEAESLKPVEDQGCADTAPFTDSSPPSPPTPPTRAKIVQLPPPPVLATLMHDTLTKAAEKTTAPPVTEQRQEVIYPKKIPRKSS